MLSHIPVIKHKNIVFLYQQPLATHNNWPRINLSCFYRLSAELLLSLIYNEEHSLLSVAYVRSVCDRDVTFKPARMYPWRLGVK